MTVLYPLVFTRCRWYFTQPSIFIRLFPFALSCFRSSSSPISLPLSHFYKSRYFGNSYGYAISLLQNLQWLSSLYGRKSELRCIRESHQPPPSLCKNNLWVYVHHQMTSIPHMTSGFSSFLAEISDFPCLWFHLSQCSHSLKSQGCCLLACSS